MKTYTVIGLNDDTGEVWFYSLSASDPHHSMRKAANVDGAPDQIICAIPGDHTDAAVCPCEDSGKAAYIEDLELEEGDKE